MAAISTSLLGPLNQFSFLYTAALLVLPLNISALRKITNINFLIIFTRCVFREHYSGRSRCYFQAMATAGIFHSPPLDSQPAGFIKAIGYIPHPSL